MIPKHVTDIEDGDLQELVTQRVEEGPTLEFKRDLPGDDRDSRRELIADVCSLANTRGGDLIYGLAEDAEGKAATLHPTHFNSDEVITRLTNVLSDTIEPKLHGVAMKAVPIARAGSVLVVRVPRSQSGFHRNKSGRDGQFWVRETKSKQPMDVPGIINRVSGLLGREDRLTDFFARRYATISTGTYPLKLLQGPKVVIHVLPTRDILSGDEIGLEAVEQPGSFLLMPNNRSSYATHTYEGVLHHHEVNRDAGTIRAGSLVFHSGVVEAVATVLPHEEGGVSFMPFESIESLCIQFLTHAVPIVSQRLGISLPLTIRIALVNANSKFARSLDRDLNWHLDPVPAVQVHATVLVYPDLFVEALPDSWGLALEKTFNRIWQSWGYARAFSYQHRPDGVYWGGHRL